MTGSKPQVCLIHGGSAYSRHEDFLAELSTRPLRDLPGEPARVKWTGSFREDMGDDFEVFMPSMPNSQNARYAEWSIWFERYVPYLRDGVVLIGWSLGGYFLLKYLAQNQLPITVKHLYLLAAPYNMAEFGAEDGADFQFDVSQIPQVSNQIHQITIMHSKDDFVVPFAHGEALAAALPTAQFVIFEDKNHFLVDKFPELLNSIKTNAGRS